ncbi:3-hydroxybutyrate oligomer hydrolase family protein [Ideonella sp.]|uniref:3-hydroxybutyrate oligomer hydrolase family protein n=1 Tax=Ideonella sp. TaxID=1929293 RepID=UPI0035AEC4B0
MNSKQAIWHLFSAVTASAALAACGGSDNPPPPPPPAPVNTLPAGVTHHSVTDYSATAPGAGDSAATQDLLTAGLGKTGLGGAAPAYADPDHPTALELRRGALYGNYRGILDYSANGGYGRLYGPNIDVDGGDTLGEGLIPGKEYIGSIDDGSGNKRVVVAVQIPSSFDPDEPCVIAGPSSGSRGVYGAISTAGEWGLKHGCAVALTDAGKGMGLYDPMDDSVNQIDGTRTTRTVAGALSHFAANIADNVRTLFNVAFPNRLALKQVHSQMNPEKDFGSDTLKAIEYAMYALNEEYAPINSGTSHGISFTADNTLVIAGSVSNGGAAVLQAAEQDSVGLIDGVVATEPSAQPADASGVGITVGGTAVNTFGKPLADYFTYANLYQPCAAQAAGAALAEVSVYNYMGLTGMNSRGVNRCTALAAKGLVSGATTAEQAADALAKLRAYGYTADNDTMHNSHFALASPVIAMMYPTGYGRFSMIDNVCGMSLAQVDASGSVVPVSATVKAQSFASGNGTANGVPATPVYNDSVGGARSWQWAVSPSTGLADFALDAALCQRALVTGVDSVTGAALTAASWPTSAQSEAVRAGIGEVQLTGNLRAKPTLIVAGRSDNVIPVNHSERAYVAVNRRVEGAASQLSYIEVFNAQHFDTFLPLSGFDTRFVPLHPYYNRAMDAMWARLKGGTALPPSQVVRTTPRGGTPGAAPAISAANVPAFAATPAAGDRIDIVGGNTLAVPN